MREILELSTGQREELVDITRQVISAIHRLGVHDGVVHLYAQGATAALMIQENWDDSVPRDVVDLLQQHIPRGVWRHDA